MKKGRQVNVIAVHLFYDSDSVNCMKVPYNIVLVTAPFD